MHLNRELLEASNVSKHYMTAEERKVKKKLCQLLIDKKHVKYARRFWDFDFNLVDAKRFPDFTAAVSFNEATVFLSTGFLGSGEAVFNQLDVLLRHELAHNLMMHQIRMMYIYKQKYIDDSDAAYESLSASSSLHTLINIIEDLEISNKRYSAEDKKIVHYMTLNGQLIGGLVTDELRPGWINMSLEDMYAELTKELDKINRDIRNDPDWSMAIENPGKLDLDDDEDDRSEYSDPIKRSAVTAMSLYANAAAPSPILCPVADYVNTKSFSKLIPSVQKIIKKVFEAFKDFCSTNNEKDQILEVVNKIAETGPQESFELESPFTGEIVCTLYTPEEKLGACAVLKNLGGLINKKKYKAKVKITKTTHSTEYTNAWNEVVTKLSDTSYDNQTLKDLLDDIMNMN